MTVLETYLSVKIWRVIAITRQKIAKTKGTVASKAVYFLKKAMN